MGYQECWVTVSPVSKFNKLAQECAKLKKAGYYQNPCTATPLSVIILKQEIASYPAGTKVLWVSGERSFCTPKGLTGKSFLPFYLSFNAAEEAMNLFNRDKQYPHNDDNINAFGFDRKQQKEFLKGIDFSKRKPTENQYMKRYSFDGYVKMINAEKTR